MKKSETCTMALEKIKSEIRMHYGTQLKMNVRKTDS